MSDMDNSDSDVQSRSSVHNSAAKRRAKCKSAREMLGSSASEVSDEEPQSTRVTRSATKKHGPRSIEKSGPKLNLDDSVSASSELEPKTPRSSSRLKEKANKTFSLPSRDSLLDDISPAFEKATPDSERRIRYLKPRRLVNNLIRGLVIYILIVILLPSKCYVYSWAYTPWQNAMNAPSLQTVINTANTNTKN